MTSYSIARKVSKKKEVWERPDIACKIYNFEEAKHQKSQREFAQENDVPRTTLQYWLSKKAQLNASAELIEFCESPAGLAFIHRILSAAVYAFTKDGVASTYNVSRFLELSGLSVFVGGSPSSCQKVSQEMDSLIIQFGKEESERLAQGMPEKSIALTSDETFHPEICMVAIEPVSNYIVVEDYVDDRTGETWNKKVKEGIKNLPVKIIQVCSDQGTGLLNHVKKGLRVHHSPDLFHVGYEIGKGTSAALASKIKKAEKAHDVAVKKLDQLNWITDLESVFQPAREKEMEARLEIEMAKANQKIALEERVKLGQMYHPYDLKTGVKKTAEEVSGQLEKCFDNIKEATKDLSQYAQDHIEKAHRVVDDLVANIAFYFSTINSMIIAMDLSDLQRRLLEEFLIPGFYLKSASDKETDKEQRAVVRKKSEEILAMADQKCPSYCSEEKMVWLKKKAKECVQVFQRSSSCVEGRNAQLSLRHHGVHRLRTNALKAQTVIHNFDLKNDEGMSPAERFFEAPHEDLFEWLVNKMSYPVRPRKPKAKHLSIIEGGRS
jgi:hypothetical protein